MTVYDCVLYDGEREMLELRVALLRDVVDQHIVVEANRTHQGARRDVVGDMDWASIIKTRPDLCDVHPLFYVAKLDHLDGTGRSEAGRPGYQVRERAHRDAIQHALVLAGAQADDVVLVSDVDEIPNPDHIWVEGNVPGLWPKGVGVIAFEQTMFVWSLRWIQPGPWTGPTMHRHGTVMPQEARDLRGSGTCLILAEGGWHFSWFGTRERRARKLRSFSHGELAHLEEQLPEMARTGVDIHGRALVPAIKVQYPSEIHRVLTTKVT